MSDLIESMTKLVTRTDALIETYEKKKTSIDTAVQSAIAAVPEHVRNVYLDQVNGNDKNDGLTSAKPIKTMAQALKLGGAGRLVVIRLLSDYTFINHREYLLSNQAVYLVGQNERRKVVLPVLPAAAPSADYPAGQCEVAGFCQGSAGHNILVAKDIEIVFPSAPPESSGALTSAAYSAFAGSFSTIGGTTLSVEIYSCEITYPADGVGVLIGAGVRPTNLVVKTVTRPSHFAGKWIGNVAAGTAVPVPGKAYIQSNLKTL